MAKDLDLALIQEFAQALLAEVCPKLSLGLIVGHRHLPCQVPQMSIQVN